MDKRTITLRSPLPGEWGWIMRVHGSLYSDHYGYNFNFERYVGEIVCEFLRNRNKTKCKAWVADVDGEPMGCILCTAQNSDPNTKVAQLRCLVVCPEAQGLGIGKRLVDECVRFARESGYKKLKLYTHGSRMTALKLYEAAGFRLVPGESGRKTLEFGPEQEDVAMELDFK